ncbi:MAG TPA: hypothetical protein PKC80_05015 [Burkholderiaceae bacterium]|nr:hypothetical protein [Burkholderiaceae bacterium]
MKITTLIRRYLWLEVFILFTLAFLALTSRAHAQGMYKCDDNSYTNVPADMVGKKCKLVQGGNVSVDIKSKQTTSSQSANTSSSASPNKNRSVDNSEQRARDSDARGILAAELKKSETKLADLLKEYNNGEPEKLGPETRNHQKYLDRIADLKASIARVSSDVEGIKRELNRNGGGSGAGASGVSVNNATSNKVN